MYEPIESIESLKDRLNLFLSHYNESIRGAGMDMVFFQDAMIHLVKVLSLILRFTKQLDTHPVTTQPHQMLLSSILFLSHTIFSHVCTPCVCVYMCVCLGFEDNPDTRRKCFVGWCWGLRQTESDQTGFIHRWLQDFPDHSHTVMHTNKSHTHASRPYTSSIYINFSNHLLRFLNKLGDDMF